MFYVIQWIPVLTGCAMQPILFHQAQSLLPSGPGPDPLLRGQEERESKEIELQPEMSEVCGFAARS